MLLNSLGLAIALAINRFTMLEYIIGAAIAFFVFIFSLIGLFVCIKTGILGFTIRTTKSILKIAFWAVIIVIGLMIFSYMCLSILDAMIQLDRYYRGVPMIKTR